MNYWLENGGKRKKGKAHTPPPQSIQKAEKPKNPDVNEQFKLLADQPDLAGLEKQLLKECNPDWKQNRKVEPVKAASKSRKGMGIPKELAGPNIVFPRQFRWTATPDSKPEAVHYFQKMVPNFVHKTLDIEIFDMVDGIPAAWIDHFLKEEGETDSITVDFYDGCGDVLFQYRFEGLMLFAHEMALDYSSSDVVKHVLMFEYTKMERINVSSGSPAIDPNK